MALQIDYIDENNQLFTDSYWKIGLDDGISGGKQNVKCKIYGYENQADADLNQNEIGIYEYDYYHDLYRGENIWIQVYINLKEDHGLFKDAIDV